MNLNQLQQKVLGVLNTSIDAEDRASLIFELASSLGVSDIVVDAREVAKAATVSAGDVIHTSQGDARAVVLDLDEQRALRKLLGEVNRAA